MLDVEGRLYFAGNSSDASDNADAKTIRPPPNDSPGTQMKLLLGLLPNVYDIYGFRTESIQSLTYGWKWVERSSRLEFAVQVTELEMITYGVRN